MHWAFALALAAAILLVIALPIGLVLGQRAPALRATRAPVTWAPTPQMLAHLPSPSILLYEGPSVTGSFDPGSYTSICEGSIPNCTYVFPQLCTQTFPLVLMPYGLHSGFQVPVYTPTGAKVADNWPDYVQNGPPAALDTMGLASFNFWSGCGENGKVYSSSALADCDYFTSDIGLGRLGSTSFAGLVSFDIGYSGSCASSNPVLCACMYV